MITLFRRIREKLIASGSLTKYLLYAIGEILLVVIGILIALQVNNWNEARNLRSQERVYLQLLRDDLILQIEENETQRSSMLDHKSIEDPLKAFLSEKFRVTDDQREEVKSLLTIIPIGRTYGAYEATFLDMTSSGKIALISDPLLKNRIIQHYQIQKRDRDVINNNTINTTEELWTKMVERDLIIISSNLSDYAINNETVEFDPEFEFLDDTLFDNLTREENMILIMNVLDFKSALIDIALQFLENSDARINRLIADIDAELEINQ